MHECLAAWRRSRWAYLRRALWPAKALAAGRSERASRAVPYRVAHRRPCDAELFCACCRIRLDGPHFAWLAGAQAIRVLTSNAGSGRRGEAHQPAVRKGDRPCGYEDRRRKAPHRKGVDEQRDTAPHAKRARGRTAASAFAGQRDRRRMAQRLRHATRHSQTHAHTSHAYCMYTLVLYSSIIHTETRRDGEIQIHMESERQTDRYKNIDRDRDRDRDNQVERGIASYGGCGRAGIG